MKYLKRLLARLLLIVTFVYFIFALVYGLYIIPIQELGFVNAWYEWVLGVFIITLSYAIFIYAIYCFCIFILWLLESLE